MAYTLDLSGCYAKLKRAQIHIDDLKRRVDEVFPNGELFTLGQKFEREQTPLNGFVSGTIFVYVESVSEVPQQWSLIVGDAVHNLRCALDHLAWQLAIRKLKGKEPTVKGKIVQIKFPVVADKKDWAAVVNRKDFRRSDLAQLKKFQPFKMPARIRARNLHAVELFCAWDGISNVDKHRKIQLTYFLPQQSRWIDGVYHDCTPLDAGTGYPGAGHIHFLLGDNPTPKPSDKVYGISVVQEGPNPRVDFQASVTGYVAIREGWNVVSALEQFATSVDIILGVFRRSR